MNKRSGLRVLPAAVLAIAAAVWPVPSAEAAPAEALTAAEHAASQGMLPLLAAMAIGIAVSVIAVLAFLQMTTRGKSNKEDESRHTDQALFTSNAPSRDDHREDRESDVDDEDVDASLGYTVPLRSLGDAPDAAERRTPEPARAEEPRLVGLSGEFAGASYRLADRPLAIGRDGHQCELVFPDGHAEISRKHCTVSYDSARRVFSLVDHGSSNGTYLRDGTRLAAGAARELRPGDRFALPGGEQWFEVDD
ncbi:FHA domain-containing protein [Cohnella sp. JJ-181]|uniref:FHA domain-containing protein n=1 Tax=Cohnella rhizoplanae TaxID=2974897 RepID=UPI0022FF5290|nr:FHA domain-containing protein [Cohnella sp. JJ-181]CAI6068430.1 hypothetical protein COHCIP112018_02179 [Cohnella sp. JJ-181]